MIKCIVIIFKYIAIHNYRIIQNCKRNILSNLFMCRQNYNSNKKYEDLITFMEQISITFMFSKIC